MAGSPTLRTYAAESPEIREELLQILARQLKRRESELTDLAGTNVTGRVARQLLHLAARFGTIRDGAVHVTASVTDAELANLTGTSGQTLHRILQNSKTTAGFASRALTSTCRAVEH
jgi:CRP/FNR family cyclic AMP-dependent transcriptional regulator